MALPDEYLSIDTPENVVFDYEVAGIGTRFLAALVDTLVILVLQVVVNVTLFLLVSSLMEDEIGMWLFAVFGLIAFAFLWGYYVFFEVIWNGQLLDFVRPLPEQGVHGNEVLRVSAIALNG